MMAPYMKFAIFANNTQGAAPKLSVYDVVSPLVGAEIRLGGCESQQMKVNNGLRTHRHPIAQQPRQ